MNFASWARRQGGVRAQEDAFRIVLRGREESPVIVNGLTAHVLSTRTPRSGWFNGWDGCGAAVDTRQVHFELERKPPSATWYDKNGEEIDPLTLQVSATEHEVIDVFAYTFREEVEWVLEVSYTSAGKDGILRIDDHGKPFVLTAPGQRSRLPVRGRPGRAGTRPGARPPGPGGGARLLTLVLGRDAARGLAGSPAAPEGYASSAPVFKSAHRASSWLL